MNHTKRLVLCGLAFLMLAALALPVSLRAQDNYIHTNDDTPALPRMLMSPPNFVYTNDDILGPNTVSGFSVAWNGTLTLLPGSPFSTGGRGVGGCFYASNRTTVSTVANFLFASNTGSSDVSVFTINELTGQLDLVEGSPFTTGGFGKCAIALSATPDGRFLMAANSGSNNITVFRIASTGALTPIAGSPFATRSMPNGIKVSPNGKFLAVAEPYAHQIEMFRIAFDGSLTPLGAYPTGGGADPDGVDINCAGSLLYDGEGNGIGTIVDGYSISQEGTLTPVPGSPFIEPRVGVNSNAVLLYYAPDQKTLFVSNQASNTITAFSVDADGSLSLVAGSPFPMNSGAYVPCGMATSWDGRLLYVANRSNRVSVFVVGEGGVLTEVAGSPFPTGQSGGLSSLAAFPPRGIPQLLVALGLCP